MIALMTCFATNAHGRRHDHRAAAVDVCGACGLFADSKAQASGCQKPVADGGAP